MEADGSFSFRYNSVVLGGFCGGKYYCLKIE